LPHLLSVALQTIPFPFCFRLAFFVHTSPYSLATVYGTPTSPSFPSPPYPFLLCLIYVSVQFVPFLCVPQEHFPHSTVFALAHCQPIFKQENPLAPPFPSFFWSFPPRMFSVFPQSFSSNVLRHFFWSQFCHVIRNLLSP